MKEKLFQKNILRELEERGWLVGDASGYDRKRALYTEDVVEYFRATQPERWEKFAAQHTRDTEGAFLDRVVKTLETKGTLGALRQGFKTAGAGAISLCGFQPDHDMNPETAERYRLNRLRVVEEVSYSPHARTGEGSGKGYNPRLDLVLFVNGIPVATLELKSEFKQSLEQAKRQYREDRPVKDPYSRKAEPLLTFKRGALVHFAVSQQEIAMTTKLAGRDTFFLPFNQGTESGGAGNPTPVGNKYAVAYLWEEILEPSVWLRILGQFLHLEVKDEEDFKGRKQRKETLIFPRYHQWDVVTELVAATREEGAGWNYLVQHSAGSGKSNSIAWLAYQLAHLYDAAGAKLFSSVIVVTDRRVLDSQLQDTIYQFEHADGVVQRIGHEGGASKSAELAEALKKQARIIIVTIQTFPALYEALRDHPQLAKGRYAVIADEAHSSQTGSSAGKLKAILSGSKGIEGAEEGISVEDLLALKVAERSASEQISYYAFTATPKAKTMELFGRCPMEGVAPSEENKPEAFHVYSMQQAIEEGFILDVLQNYTTYQAAWKLAHASAEEKVDSKKAKKVLAKWVRLHPHNIGQKVEIIVEHFRTHVRHLLDGRAKAMLVTGSRKEAVRYQLAMQKYVTEKGYDDVFPLVAFSGSIAADKYIPEEVTETSKLLNPNLRGRDHAEAFDTPEYNVMIVANKYQTGFDQPK